MEEDVPELGDLVTIISDLLGKTTGRIVYRDGTLIRVKPYQASDRAVEFPLDESTGLFIEQLGVSSIILHSKRKSPYFSKQLAVLPGTILEFYTYDSKKAAEKGIVKRVIAKGSEDSIILEDGRKIEFKFVGPPQPIAVIFPRSEEITVENEAGLNENAVEKAELVIEEKAEISDETLNSIDDLLPSDEIEIIPTTELRYNDSVQFNDMYTDLISGLDIKMQKNRKIKRLFKEQAKSFINLKNDIIHEKAKNIEYFTPKTIFDVINKQLDNIPINAIIPISKTRRSIFIDDESFETQQIVAKNEANVIALTADAFQTYDSKSSSGGVSNKYATYMNAIFTHNHGISASSGEQTNSIPVRYDQTILRHPIFPSQPQGLVSGLPIGRKIGIFGGSQKSSTTKLDVTYINKVKHNVYRALSNMTVVDPKTKYTIQIAPPDYINIIGYLVLGNDLASVFSPNNRSGVLIYDINQSEKLRQSTNFSDLLYQNFDDITIIKPGEDDLLLTDLLDKNINNVLAYNDIGVWTVLDNYGFKTLELSPSVISVINKKIDEGIEKISQDLSQAKNKALEATTQSSISIVSNIVDDTSTLFKVINELPQLKQITENIKKNEMTLASNDIVIVSGIEKESLETGRALLYASLASSERPEIFKQIPKNETEETDQKTETDKEVQAEPVGLVERLSDELNKEIRRQTIEKENSKIFFPSEEPIINTCEHVNKLNVINAIKNEAERMYLLEKCIEKYQYGMEDNWIICNICKQHLVCKHDLLLIEEFKNQYGSDVLHKALLLQFGEKGNYGSDYTCKNCGQGIGELEFDTRIEFDDDGKPMIGRSIIEPGSGILEGMNPADFISDLVAGIRETDIIKRTPAEQNIYNLLKILFETAGASPNEHIYSKLIRQIHEYIHANEKNEYGILTATYNKAKRSVPSREVFNATFLLSVISAFLIVELQISENELPINIPYPHCLFSRDGYPRDGDDPKSVSNGLIDYIVCILSNIDREDPPWIDTLWSAETLGSTRRNTMIKYQLINILKNLKKLPTVGDALQKSKNDYERRLMMGQLVGASKDDRLPPSFRPATMLKGASDGVEAVPAFTNIEMFKKSVINDPVESIKPLVDRRELILAQQVIEQFHENALRTKQERPGQSKRSDGHCCETSFENAKKIGLGINSLESENVINEIDVVRSAVKAIMIRDPVLPSAGTHFITLWSANPIESYNIEPDSSVYFRLFFKACASGANSGRPHEYGTDNICRRCGLYLPIEIPYMSELESRIYQKIADADDKKDTKKRQHYENELEKLVGKRNELYQKSLSDISIVVSPESFSQLQDNIRAVKYITSSPPIIIEKFSYGFDLLTEIIKKSSTLYGNFIDDWKELIDFIVNDSELKDEAREIKFGNFVSKFDLLKNVFVSQYISLADNVRSQAVFMKEQGIANMLINVIDRIIENCSRAPRLLITMLVVPLHQIATGVKIEVNSANWFPNIAPLHREELDKYWKKHYDNVQEIQNLLEEDEDVKNVVQKAFERVSNFLGSVFQIFIAEIRAGQLLNHHELSFVIGWFLRSSLCASISESSSIYAGSPSIDVSLKATKIFKTFITSTLKYISNKLNLFDMSKDKIKNSIDARNAIERVYFIRIQDNMTPEEKHINNIFKSLGIGSYSEGALKDNFKYDADYFEFHRNQRSDYKLPDFSTDVSNVPSKLDDFGMSSDTSAFSVGESGGHYEKQHEDD